MASNELRTIEIDIYTYNYLVKTENKLELIRGAVKENSTVALEIIRAILGIKETASNG